MGMIYEKETLPIIYLSKEEVDAFLSSNIDTQDGIAYIWENEQVVHLHTTAVSHSFGKTEKVVFCKASVAEGMKDGNCAVQWIVSIEQNGNATVYSTEDGFATAKVANMIPSKEDLYSRNKGILEIGILEKKHVAIIGLGSFGSQISIELAKAGVGEFSLFDFDRVELHNLSRHTCTTKDLGRLKTDALEESILGKNPYAKVNKYPIDINKNVELLESVFDSFDIVVCATDNNQSRFVLSHLLVKYKKIGVFGRAITRAEGGDVFVYRPGDACYNCLVGNIGGTMEEITNEESARRIGAIAAYVSPEDADAMVQVGLSADIAPICNMMEKIVLMELSRGEASGISSLEGELVFNYYIWANRRERKYANFYPMPGAGAMPTIMRWYGSRIKKNDGCNICGNSKIVLDEGEEYEHLINKMSN